MYERNKDKVGFARSQLDFHRPLEHIYADHLKLIPAQFFNAFFHSMPVFSRLEVSITLSSNVYCSVLCTSVWKFTARLRDVFNFFEQAVYATNGSLCHPVRRVLLLRVETTLFLTGTLSASAYVNGHWKEAQTEANGAPNQDTRIPQYFGIRRALRFGPIRVGVYITDSILPRSEQDSASVIEFPTKALGKAMVIIVDESCKCMPVQPARK